MDTSLGLFIKNLITKNDSLFYLIPKKMILFNFRTVFGLLALFVGSGLRESFADVKGNSSGTLNFHIDNSGNAKAVLNSTGLGIGTVPSANLHVMGNAQFENFLGLGTISPRSTLEVSGTLAMSTQQISSNTALSDHSLVLVNTSSDNVVVTLPYAGNVSGRAYTIKKVSASNAVLVRGGGNYIDNSTGLQLTTHSMSYSSASVISDGKQWYSTSISDNAEGQIASGNLVCWWKLDESSSSGNVVADSSTRGRSGIRYNVASSNIGVLGQVSGAVDLDGSDDYVSIAATDSDFLGDITICFWGKLKSQGTASLAVSKHTSNGAKNNPFSFGFTNNSPPWLWFTVANSSSSNSHTAYKGNGAVVGEWRHYAVTLSTPMQSTGQFYINGVAILTSPDTSGGGTGSRTGSNAPILLGRRADGNYSNILLDDVRIYNKVLSVAELLAIYNLTR